MPIDPRRIVADGYDAAASEYARWVATQVVDPARGRYEAAFSALLPPRSDVLELGCGGGGPTTAHLAQRFALTGIDISREQIARARDRVPGAAFLHADMTRFRFPPASFDGIAAFYSLIHLPFGELPAMLARVATWLRADGVFVASFGARANASGEHFEPDWLGGAPMYWSGYPREEYMRFLQAAPLSVIESGVETHVEDGTAARFLWVLARKTALSGPAPSYEGP